jgi:uncharacterized membrane protein YkoI
MMLTKIVSRIVFSVIAVAMFTLSAVAQEQEKKVTAKDVPAVVITNFKTAYPNATIRGYASEKENGKQYYEVESREGTLHRDVLYNPDGTVAEVEESIDANALPAPALQTLKQQYPRAVITLAEKTTAGGTITYEVSARQGRKRITIEFDANGKMLPKTKK